MPKPADFQGLKIEVVREGSGSLETKRGTTIFFLASSSYSALELMQQNRFSCNFTANHHPQYPVD